MNMIALIATGGHQWGLPCPYCMESEIGLETVTSPATSIWHIVSQIKVDPCWLLQLFASRGPALEPRTPVGGVMRAGRKKLSDP